MHGERVCGGRVSVSKRELGCAVHGFALSCSVCCSVLQCVVG